jgi:hypothetical protein
MHTFYVIHRAGRGVPRFVKAESAHGAVRRVLAGAIDDGRHEAFPTVIDAINNEN